MTSARRRLIATELCEHFHVSQRRASRALGLPRSSLRYAPVAATNRRRWPGGSRNWPACTRGTATGGSGPCWTARAGRSTRRRCGGSGGSSGLKLARPRANPKPRRPHGQDANACHLRPSRGKDDVWTWDFIFDRTSDGRSLKWLSLMMSTLVNAWRWRRDGA